MQETKQGMPRIESFRGTLTLMMGHCAGMMDLIALPIWVGTLMAHYQFNPQQAGGMPTLFLIGASLSSLYFASRFNRLNAKWNVVLGFAAAGLTFLVCSQVSDISVFAPLHFVGGLAVGLALSFTHGTIGHAKNPHRVFAFAGMAIGVFGIIFLGSTPGLIARFGGPALFQVFSGVMFAAAALALVSFPYADRTPAAGHARHATVSTRLTPAVWFSIVACALLATTQAMTMSFFERIGAARGFSREMITLSLVVYGLVTLFPAPLAGLLERRLKAVHVVSTVPVMQAVFAMIVTHTSSHILYTASAALMAFTIIFSHTYAFGLLARLDPSGRATAGTPATLMTGAAIAPFLGGTLVHLFGFGAIGYAAIVFVAIELLLFNLTRRAVQSPSGAVRSGAAA